MTLHKQVHADDDRQSIGMLVLNIHHGHMKLYNNERMLCWLSLYFDLELPQKAAHRWQCLMLQIYVTTATRCACTSSFMSGHAWHTHNIAGYSHAG